MKRLNFIFLFIVCSQMFAHGQIIYKLNKDTSNYKYPPLFLIASQNPFTASIESLIKPEDVDSIRSCNKIELQELEHKYQTNVKNGVLRLKLKPAVKLKSYQEILVDYQIPLTDRKLPLFIDSNLTPNTHNTYFEPAAIKTMKIDTEKETGMVYINVRSTFVITHYSKNAIHIR